MGILLLQPWSGSEAGSARLDRLRYFVPSKTWCRFSRKAQIIICRTKSPLFRPAWSFSIRYHVQTDSKWGSPRLWECRPYLLQLRRVYFQLVAAGRGLSQSKTIRKPRALGQNQSVVNFLNCFNAWRIKWRLCRRYCGLNALDRAKKAKVMPEIHGTRIKTS